MRYIILVISLLITGCIHTVKNPDIKDTKHVRSKEYQQEIDAILAEDAENKRWEEIYLKEIAIAQENDDVDAYKFFIVEYIRVPRIPIPDWMKEEPGYVERKTAAAILRGQFMREAGLKIIITPK